MPGSKSNGEPRAGGTRRVRIRDVAEAAQVAPSTVSNALNGLGQVDPATRERIARVATDLGYVPNRTARSLRTGRAGVLGIMLSSRPQADETANAAYNLRLIGSASRAAFRRHNALLLLPPLQTPEHAARLELDGVILIDIEAGDRAARAFSALGTPVVTIEADPSNPDHDYWVGADTATNTRTGLDHLMATEASRVAYVGHATSGTWSRQSHEGYLSWCRERGQDPLVELIPATRTYEECAAATGRLLERDDAPDAIFALTERLAVTIGNVLRERGVSIPGQVRILAGSDGERAALAHPAISAIDLHPEEVGAAAVALLGELIEGRDTERPRIVRATLNARLSTTGAR